MALRGSEGVLRLELGTNDRGAPVSKYSNTLSYDNSIPGTYGAGADGLYNVVGVRDSVGGVGLG